MEVIYLLIPVALVLVAVIIWALVWSVRSGQFDDLEGPAYRILMDDEIIRPKKTGDLRRPARGGTNRRNHKTAS